VETGFPKRSCSTEHERPFHHPPALRRDHHPLRRGRLVCSLSPSSVITGCGAGGGGCVGAGCDASWLPEIGAGSRTVERRRGGSSAGGAAACGGAFAGSGDAGGGAGGAAIGAASRSATASFSSGSVAGGAASSSAVVSAGCGACAPR